MTELVITATGTQGPSGIFWQDGAWSLATSYKDRDGVQHDGSTYRCIAPHVAAAGNEPGTGASWQDVWKVLALRGDLTAGFTGALADAQSAQAGAEAAQAAAATSALEAASSAGTPAPVISSFTAVRTRIMRNADDVTMLFIGDSTADSTTEWIYLFAAWLGSIYPAHSVKYYKNDGTAYDPATAVTTGSGPNSIHIYNASMPGWKLSDWMGARYAHAIAPLAPDVIVTNSEMNRAGLANTKLIRSVFLEALQQILGDKPDTPVAVTLQNPFRDDDGMDYTIDALRDAAGFFPGMTLIDSHSRFIEADKPASWYLDNAHPNATGQAVILEEVKRHWLAARDLPPFRTFRPWWDDRKYFNLIENGDFENFSGALPDGFTQGGTGTVSKETTIVYPGKSYSVKVASTNSSFIRYEVPVAVLEDMKGKVCSLAVRLYALSGGGNSTGRTEIYMTGYGHNASTDYSTTNANYAQDGWIWQVITDIIIPRDVGYMKINFYGCAHPVGTAFFDEVILYEGNGRPVQAR